LLRGEISDDVSRAVVGQRLPKRRREIDLPQRAKYQKPKISIEMFYVGSSQRSPHNFPSFSCGPLETWRGSLTGHMAHFENHPL
jgi:hypothetical protein